MRRIPAGRTRDQVAVSMERCPLSERRKRDGTLSPLVAGRADVELEVVSAILSSRIVAARSRQLTGWCRLGDRQLDADRAGALHPEPDAARRARIVDTQIEAHPRAPGGIARAGQTRGVKASVSASGDRGLKEWPVRWR